MCDHKVWHIVQAKMYFYIHCATLALMTAKIMKPALAIDFDDVLMSFNQGFIAYHNRMHDTQVTYEGLTTFDMTQTYKCDRETLTQRVKDFYKSIDHAKTTPTEGSTQAINLLRNHFQLHIITSRPDIAKKETFAWISKFFPELFHQIHFTNGFAKENGTVERNKSAVCLEIGAVALIEDAPHHAKEVSLRGVKVLMPDRPWNRSETPAGVVRVHSWKETLSHLGIS
jgi:5'(3')-deoxyribonucleotidase